MKVFVNVSDDVLVFSVGEMRGEKLGGGENSCEHARRM